MKKHPDLYAVLSWRIRKAEADAFLASIGDANVIKKVMGKRFRDVRNALKGVQPFMLDGPAANADAEYFGFTIDEEPLAHTAQPQDKPQPSSLESGPSAGIAPPSVSSSTPVESTGQKRKRSPADLGENQI